MSAAPAVLVVASWYPSVDGLAAGRFVADQATAIRDSGRFVPVVVTFDPLGLWGSARLRRREAAAVREIARAGLARAPGTAFRRPAGGGTAEGLGVAPVAVARLPVPGAARGVGPSDRAVVDRAEVLEHAAQAIDGVAGAPILVHAHTGFPDGPAASLEAARRGVPLVITEHLSTLAAITSDPVRRTRYLAALGAATRVIAVSDVLAGEIRQLAPDVSGRLVVIPNVVAVDAFEANRPDGRRPGEILFVGNRKVTKGIGLLLDAFAIARAERASLRLRLVGAAPATLDDEWRRRAAGLGLADGVDFEPETDRPGVAAAMSRASLFVHPSPRETFGVVAAEALAAGLPVVAVASGGVAEVLGPDPRLNGALVPPGDPAALAAAILDVLDRLDEFPAAVLRGRARARFGPSVVAAQIAAAYREAIAEGPRRSGSSARTASAAHSPAGDTGVPPSTSRSPGPPPATPGRPASGIEGQVILVGFDRARAARILSSMPAAERGRIVLVTADAAAPAIPPGVASVRAVAGFDARYAALGEMADIGAASAPGSPRRRALLAHPGALLRELRQRLPGRERTLLDSASDVVAAVAAPGAALVVLDGFDALAAEPIVRWGRVATLPGSGRWLAAGGLPAVAGAARASAAGAPAPPVAGAPAPPVAGAARASAAGAVAPPVAGAPAPPVAGAPAPPEEWGGW